MRIENLCILTAILIMFAICIACFVRPQGKLPKKSTYMLWSVATALMILPTIILLLYQIVGNYSFTYVYEHTGKSLPTVYKISALWSGQQGSLLLWSVILAIFGYFVIRYSLQSNKKSLGIYSTITIFISLLTLLTNPFKTMPFAADGLGLTAALQDPWMAFHPPLVFIGYTAMAVLFALFPTVNTNAPLVKKWLRVSLAFLGLGILSGSVWAYRALGWGGYWAWDAIENIALVPWLIMCAYLHGKVRYTKLMCILPFSIAAFGTFLTRSGVLKDTSVHAYASSNSNVALIVLIALLIILALYTGLLIKFKKICLLKIDLRDKMQIFRALTYIYSGIILAATVIPIIISIEVTLTFYNVTTSIYALLISLLLVWYQCARAKKIDFKHYIYVLLINTILTIVLLLFFRDIKFQILLLFWACLIPLSSYILSIKQVYWSAHHLSHFFVILLILGAIASSGFSAEFMDIIDIQSNTITVLDKTFSAHQIKDHKTLMVNKLSGDFIISNIEPLQDNANSAVVTYASKPLIYLFWIGGFGLIGYCFYCSVRKKRV
ncbi:MAG TPA: cytochrome c biogenesis protein CcsA [Ruminiclostridium sp.]